MDIELDIRKTVEENAATYFEKSKKAKRKLAGVKEIIAKTRQKIQDLEELHQEEEEHHEQKRLNPPAKKEWFEKFRWCISSDGFLIIGGRDATTNEIVIKKYTDPDDLVFHTETPGSPFVIIKNPDKQIIPDATKEEAAQLCGIFSKQWKAERSVGEIFMITPSQVSKEAKSGEYISKGSFMISGHRTFYHPDLNPAIVVNNGTVMCGPLTSVKAYATKNTLPFLELTNGQEKLSTLAKTIQKQLGGQVDDIIRALPQSVALKKQKKK